MPELASFAADVQAARDRYARAREQHTVAGERAGEFRRALDEARDAMREVDPSWKERV